MAMKDCGGANSRFLGLVSGGSMHIRSNGIETVCYQKNLSNDVKYITQMQLRKNMEMYIKMKKEETL